MPIISFKANKIIWKHIDDVEKAKGVVIEFLSNNKEEQKVLSDILGLFMLHRGQGLTGRDFEEIKNKHNLPKATFWRLLRRLEIIGIIRISGGARLYYIVPDFARALSKVSRAYRRMF